MPRAKSNISPSKAASKPSSPIHDTMDTLVQGISQQPGHLRLPGQGELQENGWSSPVEGLTKRNPARLALLFSPTEIDNFYLEMFQMAKDENYAFLLYPADDYETSENLVLVVRNTDGTSVSPDVHGPGLTKAGDIVLVGKDSYLWADPFDGTDARLFSRYSLINTASGAGSLLNKTKTVAMSDEKTPVRENNGIVFVQAVQYQAQFSVFLAHDGAVTAVPVVTTPSASDDDNFISTSVVAEQIAANINGLSGWNATQSSYVVEVKRDDGTEFAMSMDDGRANVLARAFTEKVGAIVELPLRAPNDYLVNVESDPTTNIDDRWLVFRTRDGSEIGDGAWAEAAAPDIQYKLDEETMPYHVRREARNVIYIGPADGATRTVGDNSYEFPAWGERTTGNDETVPSPDIVGDVLNDHVFFRERYVLAGGDTVQFSEVGDAYNFFQDSVLGITDQDGFAVTCASEVSSPLRWILPIDENLLIWSSSSQFQIRSADSEALSARTAVMVRLSNIVMNDMVKPKLAAAKVLFSSDEYGFSHVREFDFFNNRQARLGLNLGGSNDITLNLPKYIPGMITHWDVSESADFAVARTPDDPQKVFIYKYQWGSAQAGLQKIQASWSVWKFGGDVQWMKFMENDLWMVVTYPNRTELHILQSDELVSPTDPTLKLDRQILYPEVNDDFILSDDVSAAYDQIENRTTFTLSFPPAAGGKIQAVTRFSTGKEQNEGLLLGETTGTTMVCDQPGDWREASIVFGEPYLFKYEFTKAYVAEANQANNRRVGKLTGRTQILTWEIHHKDTGFYKVRVNRKNRSEDSLSVFRAMTLGVSNNLLTTEQSFSNTGTFRVPVYSRNVDCSITVESDSWLPLTVSSASWEGTYSDRSKG